ncbi:hypothetical protein D3C86_1661640 [compost metagenome]
MSTHLFRSRIMVTYFTALNSTVTDYRCCEIQVYCLLGGTYTVTGITTLFCRAGSHVTWYQVTEGRVSSFQVVISFLFRNLAGLTVIVLFFRHPDTTIIT